jgi:hypothetical protein
MKNNNLKKALMNAIRNLDKEYFKIMKSYQEEDIDYMAYIEYSDDLTPSTIDWISVSYRKIVEL